MSWLAKVSPSRVCPVSDHRKYRGAEFFFFPQKSTREKLQQRPGITRNNENVDTVQENVDTVQENVEGEFKVQEDGEQDEDAPCGADSAAIWLSRLLDISIFVCLFALFFNLISGLVAYVYPDEAEADYESVPTKEKQVAEMSETSEMLKNSEPLPEYKESI